MARHPLRLWRHYMDDTYTITKKAYTQEFTEYLNTVDADIKWTTEGEVEMVITEDADEEIVWHMIETGLAFLDTWSVISPDGLIKTKVFRKETHTQTSTSISRATTLWNTREVWYAPFCTELKP